MIDYDVSDGLCVLRLNAPPVNAITFPLLEALRAAVARANADAAVDAIVITGRPDHFSAGADVDLFRQIACRDDALRVSRVFQEALQDVEDSAKCVAAAVAGKLMGSAVELASACHVRVCAAGSTFAMPEVRLGINPGAGATQRLPRLVGPAAALEMLLTARTVGAEEALAIGLVDAVCPPGEVLDRARALLAAAGPPRRTSRRTDKLADAAANEAAFARADQVLRAIRPEIVAPGKIVQAVRTGLEESVEAGFRAEQDAVPDCMDTLAAQNRIYLFFATRRTSKAPELDGVAAGRIDRAAVVGMGSMGAGIVHAMVLAGVPVTVFDADPAAVERGLGRLRRSLERRVADGKLAEARAEEMLALVSPADRWEDLAGAGLVIEAVYEDAAAKRVVLGAAEAACGDDAVLATNTSTISLDALAEGLRRGERLVGMHFFNPAHRMPLVEVIRRDGTSPAAIATAIRFAKAIRKTPVLVRNREGFLVNRIFVPYFKEAFYLLADGADPPAVDRAMVAFGFPMGPLALIDMAGIDILAAVDAVMSRAFPRHGTLSPIALRLVEAGFCGQKTGQGVYRYERGDYAPHRSEAAEEVIAAVRREVGRPPGEIDAEEITRRCVLRMVNEAFYVLAEGIAQRESDIDAAMVLGTGFPDFRGGVLKYARDLGLGEVLSQLDELARRVGERFSPCQLLREMEGA